jgi:FkbM family methyltransferase
MGLLRQIKSRLARPGQISFAQSGEDLICWHLLNYVFRIEKPTYLDVGAHHPTHFSNSYFFSKRRCYGVMIEPDPTLHALIRQKRPKDICLNCGIGKERASQAEFFIFNVKTLNTFSAIERDANLKLGYVLEKTMMIPLMPIDEIIEKHFHAQASPFPNFFSLDTEGYDLQILESLDFARYRPEVICVETLEYASQNKTQPIFDLMAAKGYRVYADTFINTIFVENRAWESRRKD